MTRDILDRLDSAIDGLCPCGGQPRPGSIYCSYDCEPTHRSHDTDLSGPGEYGAQSTAMRWRPDLLTAHDDRDLTPIPVERGRIGYTGRHNPAVFERADGRLHFRLDDGHRYVGCDVDTPTDERGVLTFAATASIRDAWQRLDRDLGNPRHAEPARSASAWDTYRQAAHQRREHNRQQICAWLQANRLNPNDIPNGSPIRIRGQQICVREVVRDSEGQPTVNGWDLITAPRTVPLLEPWPAGLHYDGLDIEHEPVVGATHVGQLVSEEAMSDLRESFRRLTAGFQRTITLTAPGIEQMRHLVDGLPCRQPEPESADHPLARMNARRRNTPHGPQQPQHPPRQISR